MALHEDQNVKLTIPNKTHFIIDHLEDYFDTTKESLGETSDQTIEAMHSFVDKLMKKSMYHVKDTSKDIALEKQHRGILRINSYSVNIKNN